MISMCIPNLKTSLYNLSQTFQAYESDVGHLLHRTCKIYPDLNLCKYYASFSVSNSVRYFDKDEDGNKIIFKVTLFSGRKIEDPEIQVRLGYIVNVFYVDNYESYTYNYLDLNIPENNYNNTRDYLNIIGGSRKLSNQRKISRHKKHSKNKKLQKKSKTVSSSHNKS